MIVPSLVSELQLTYLWCALFALPGHLVIFDLEEKNPQQTQNKTTLTHNLPTDPAQKE